MIGDDVSALVHGYYGEFQFREGDPFAGEKIFKCTVCEYKAKHQSNAVRHVKFMHLTFSENLQEHCYPANQSYLRRKPVRR